MEDKANFLIEPWKEATESSQLEINSVVQDVMLTGSDDMKILEVEVFKDFMAVLAEESG
jgi:hypothetical protein